MPNTPYAFYSQNCIVKYELPVCDDYYLRWPGGARQIYSTEDVLHLGNVLGFCQMVVFDTSKWTWKLAILINKTAVPPVCGFKLLDENHSTLRGSGTGNYSTVNRSIVAEFLDLAVFGEESPLCGMAAGGGRLRPLWCVLVAKM